MAREGARVICVDKIEETNVETANKIREEIKGIAHPFTCDVTKRDQIDDLHTKVSITQCSKIRKKVQFQKYKSTFFAISKIAKNKFLHQKKV